MTAKDTLAQRLRMARTACLVAMGILVGFAPSSQCVFSLLGVSVQAVQVASALVLLLVALDMLRAQRSPIQETAAESVGGSAKDDVEITPPVIPMLAGPAAISTVIFLEAQVASWIYQGVLLACVALVGLASYAVLAIGASGAKWMSPLADKIITRLTGLLLAALAVQFLFTELKGEGGLFVR